MSHKRKPEIKPVPVAAEGLCWRARILTEFLEGYVEQLSEQTNMAVNKLVDAIAVYEAARDYKPPVKEEKP